MEERIFNFTAKARPYGSKERFTTVNFSLKLTSNDPKEVREKAREYMNGKNHEIKGICMHTDECLITKKI